MECDLLSSEGGARAAELSQALTSETETSVDRDEELLSTLSVCEIRKLELSVKKLHHNRGHSPNHVLVRMLCWKGAKDRVLASARRLRCSACEEAKPPGAKPVSAVHESREHSRVVGYEMAEWTHPLSEERTVHLWICVDEAKKFTVGHVWAGGLHVGNIDGGSVLEFLQKRWISTFGRVHILRTDPGGA